MYACVCVCLCALVMPCIMHMAPVCVLASFGGFVCALRVYVCVPGCTFVYAYVCLCVC